MKYIKKNFELRIKTIFQKNIILDNIWKNYHKS